MRDRYTLTLFIIILILFGLVMYSQSLYEREPEPCAVLNVPCIEHVESSSLPTNYNNNILKCIWVDNLLIIDVTSLSSKQITELQEYINNYKDRKNEKKITNNKK